ncbi:uncharacterized protein SCODWIG_03720 [Saccharomycodes ludwigii]|uniref:PA14 domain-containing protein n=1 Tax=Saccharomycodes ludwigii TaxID=36035 RepID=A0A376BBK0_9ASCO|nr:uncharacterized protein SCODWIG_03720 [Saccharomycodes ludwigii]
MLTTVDSNGGCNPISKPSNGFKVRWFPYNIYDTTTYTSREYMAYGYYQNSKPYHEQNGITSVIIQSGFPCQYNENDPSQYYLCNGEPDQQGTNWHCPYQYGHDATLCYNDNQLPYTLPVIFDYNTTFTNFTMELTGYFLAPQTGSYTFTLGYVDDSAGLLFGENAFGCCQQNDITASTTNFLVDAIKNWHVGIQNYAVAKITMNAGSYYPIRIVFSNAITKASLFFTISLPDGTLLDDMTNYIFTFDEEESYCPAAEDVTTTYTPWTGTYTSTIGTSLTTSIGSDGIPTTSTIYTVETPEVEGTTTTYTPWTGTYTSTIGTSVTTSVGSDGIPTTSTIYTVETPEVEGTTTTYTPWTDSRS